MIQPSSPVKLSDVPAAHARALFDMAPKSHEGLPIYIGALVFVPLAKLRYSVNSPESTCQGIAGIRVLGIGDGVVYFKHGQFGTADRVDASRCFFDHLKALSMIDGLADMHTVRVTQERLLSTYAPPPAGGVSMVEFSA